MRINTSAQEMAIQAPQPNDLEMMKYVFPTPSEFPYPDPETVLNRYSEWVTANPTKPLTDSSRQFITGFKLKGKGFAISSYPRLYPEAIVHLEALWDIRDQPEAIVDYFKQHPIRYKVDKNPTDAVSSDGFLDIPEYVARCFSNLMEWIYLPSYPAYQNLREQLLEKVRYIRKKFSESAVGKGYVYVLPQRPTTSRSLGQDETPIFKVNGGYRVVETVDPYTEEKYQILELITWFYTDSQTKLKVYKDYFDVVNGDMNAALAQLRRSELYRIWARQANPVEYDRLCANFIVDEALQEEELKNLTPLA